MAGLERGSFHLVMNHLDVSDTGVKVVDRTVLVDIVGECDVTLEFPLPVFVAWLDELNRLLDVAIAEADHAKKESVA